MAANRGVERMVSPKKPFIVKRIRMASYTTAKALNLTRSGKVAVNLTLLLSEALPVTCLTNLILFHKDDNVLNILHNPYHRDECCLENSTTNHNIKASNFIAGMRQD